MYYAIKIDGKYFKEYIYAEKNIGGRFGGITEGGSVIREGDIIDIVTTEEVERTEVRRSIGNTISTLYGIDMMRDKKIEIVPIRRSR